MHWQIFVLTVVEISELYGNFLTVCHTLKGIMSIKWVTLEVPVYVLSIVYTPVILPVRQSYSILYTVQYIVYQPVSRFHEYKQIFHFRRDSVATFSIPSYQSYTTSSKLS